MQSNQIGQLAAQCGYDLPVRICKSRAGFYLGTSLNGEPVSRESEEYWGDESDAQHALETNEWTQRTTL